MKEFFTRTDCVIGMSEQQMLTIAPYIYSIYVQGREGKETDLTGLDIEGMLMAIAADCQAGNMAQINSRVFSKNNK